MGFLRKFVKDHGGNNINFNGQDVQGCYTKLEDLKEEHKAILNGAQP